MEMAMKPDPRLQCHVRLKTLGIQDQAALLLGKKANTFSKTVQLLPA